MRRRLPRLKLKIRRVRRVHRRMARRRRFARARTVYRRARRAYRRGSRSFGRGTSMQNIVHAGEKGIFYSTVASRFAPQFAPLAELYGNWKGGGLIGVAAWQLFLNNLLGRPSALGSLGLGNLLGGLGGGGQQMGGAV